MGKLIRTGLMIVAVGVISLGAFSCRKQAGSANQPAPPPPPSDQACLAWAAKVEHTINAGDPNFLNSTFDRRRLAEKAVEDLAMPESQKRAFVQGFLQGTEFGTSIVKSLRSDSGRYKFLRLLKVAGETKALFRMVGEGGLNCHEFSLSVDPKGSVNAYDVYTYTSGETVSQSTRNLATLAFGDRFSGSSVIDPLASMTAYFKAGKETEFLAEYHKLSEGCQKDKSVMVMRLAMAEKAGEPEFSKAVADFQKLFPNDPSMELNMVDWYLDRKEYGKCLECLDKLQQRMGQDAYLDVLKANLYIAQGLCDKAKPLLASAIKAEPDLKNAYWASATIALDEKDFKTVALLLTKLEKDLGEELADLKGVPEYAEFVKSPEYEKWMASRKNP